MGPDNNMIKAGKHFEYLILVNFSSNMIKVCHIRGFSREN